MSVSDIEEDLYEIYGYKILMEKSENTLKIK